MDDQSKYTKLYVGSMITLRALEKYLKDEQIPSLIKNYSESARLAGFGSSESANELFVFEEDFNNAKKVLTTFLQE
jgi:hypothetical protein